KIDFLTPLGGRKAEVLEHEQLGVNLQSLRFMEFILEDVSQAAVISAIGACVVTVPDPARFALHTILVHVERRQGSPGKAAKDLAQAAALIEVIGPDQMDRLEALWTGIYQRGPGWRERARKGVLALRKLAPDLPAIEMMSAVDASSRRPPQRKTAG
ncbi:MAG TPA: GSU2403 family nucleotidyltransferase fold protein, partial [Usitatibacter sp.]|nr:GSU2403 family nucleotidyltransferase fold protein [Usitatibacter sp.]